MINKINTTARQLKQKASNWYARNILAGQPAPLLFENEYPYVPEDMMSPDEKISLTLREKIYFIEKEIHRIRCEIIENDNQCFFTRDQTYRLCLYRKEIDELKRTAEQLDKYWN